MNVPLAFAYQALPMRVVLGAGALDRLADEICHAGLQRVMVLCAPGRRDLAETVAERIGPHAVDIHPHARMHVPAESAAEAQRRAEEVNADGCVAVGGGSAIGLGKIIALQYRLPVIAVPTTYAGSEMTLVWGLTENGVKRTGKDPRVLPVSVLYDPALTVTLPVAVSVTSGMNAIAHAVEALYAPDASPVIDLMAEEGVRALATALPGVVADGADLDARARAQYGAWLCGACLGATSMSLHHKLCHALGGTLDLPHAPTHTVVLPHVLAYNQGAAPKAVAALGRALGTPTDPATHLWDLAGRLGAPRSLRELGMAKGDIDRIVDVALTNPYANPREVTAEALGRLLRSAWSGQPPAP
ncbi:maleylacetate reductase [Streptomyces griseorubiginosus]|uniref:maleylacetate reductase n=1 Tax=Streptomyces griseorubiginosus TaxID=67304 RepID=UPI003647673D